LHQLLQISERVVRSWRRFGLHRFRIATMLGDEALMLVLVAVGAQQLPVAAVRRIVVVIVVAVMDFQQLQIAMREVAAAPPAHPRIDLERLLAISFGALFARPTRLGYDAI